MRCFLFAALVMFAPITAHAVDDTRPDLTVAVNAEPNNLDPASAPFAANFRVTYSIFDTLIQRDYQAEIDNPSKGLTLKPGLAASWRRIDDQSIELKLREGVHFHSGREMTAADVAYSLSKERIFGDKAVAAQAKPYLGDIDAVKVVDKFTVIVHSAKSNAVLEYQLASPQAAIVPENAYSQGVDYFKRHPVGTGPIKFVEWVDGDHLKFNAFDDYFGGRPNFRTVTYRFVPEQASRIAGLVSGEFDLIVQVTPDQLNLLKTYPDITTSSVPLQNTQEILFDVRDPVVASADVRKALSLAIDRNLILTNIFAGSTTVPTSWEIPEMGAIFVADRHATDYNPALARELLAKGGYNGAVITLRYPAGYYPNGEAVAQVVANMWNAIGVKTELSSTETIGQITAGGSAASLISFTYDMPIPEKGVCAYRGEGTWSAKWMPRMEVFYSGCQQLAGLFDGAQRKELFTGMLDDLEASMPSALLYQQPQAFAFRKEVHFQAYPHLVMDMRAQALSFNKGAGE
ncbi:hypothetical protein GOD21_30750 [Sinorhizobium medicae]|nr:hypothetical protein [Sinorhizobium medicae]